ncbi:hypothetical protein DY000_02038828 [Brassica cretica]|uniref:Uncharacterized protein n=1 Tax=Brassica cretica TaxID=69181 RepID=A0ABQ7BH85_BRACR|nr:hypothetical protein DY000_02038828 [Brassica cretica]
MSSAQGLSRQQRGKSVAAASAPARGPDRGCIGDLESTHHEAMMDTVDLSRSNNFFVNDNFTFREQILHDSRSSFD